MTLESIELELDVGEFRGTLSPNTCLKCGRERRSHIKPVSAINLYYCPRVVLSRELAEMEPEAD